MLESLDSTILFAFTEEAQSYLPAIRRGVALAANDEDLQLAFRHTHTIKGAALMVGLNEISESAGKIESTLELVVNEQNVFDQTIADRLAVCVDELETLLGEVVTTVVRESNEQIVNSFVELGAVPEENEPFGNSHSQGKFEDQFDDEEIDAEMLEVFAEEAEDLLHNIGEQLKIVEQNPQSATALGEIRRSAHTLKGAAAVCGFRRVASIAHRLEDLLDRLAENPFDSNAETSAIILTTTDLLARLTRGEKESAIEAEIERLFARFDQILSRSTRKPEIHSSPAETYETKFENKHRNELENNHFAPPQTLPSTHQTNFAATENESRNEENSDSNVQSTIVKKTVVRVGLDRLDELVRLVGELVISRNALEGRLAQIETQLAEMSRNNRRLKNISGRLETDYEISMFSGGNFSSNSFPPNFPSAQVSSVDLSSATNREFDALEFDRYTEFHQLTRELAETASDAAGINSELEDLAANLDTSLSRQRRATEEMQEKLMRLRMVPLATLHARLERTIRVTAEQENKLADFELEGADVELDTQVLDTLTEPLLHLLRNSIAHGIESPVDRERVGKPSRGSIRLAVAHEGTHVVFTVADDGRGLDLEKLRRKAVENNFLSAEAAAALDDEEAAALVFLPGLSTAEQISEVAGRGVGMDAVRESIERQQGTIAIKSKFGGGLTITIRLPMSLAVTSALLVKAFDSLFAIPVGMIQQLTEIHVSEFEKAFASKTLDLDGISHQHRSLNSLLGFPELVERNWEFVPVIVLKSESETIALSFDQIVEACEIVIKPFDNLLRRIRGLLGATILGDGSVIPILDLFALLNRSAKQTPATARVYETRTVAKREQLSVLIVDDSTSVRRVMTSLMTKTGWRAVAAKDGIEALELLQNARQLPDVILSDVEMPRMDGYEFVAALRQQNYLQQVPVVMITSRAGEKHRRKAFETGVAEYITKPYQDAFLIETIKKLCRQNEN